MLPVFVLTTAGYDVTEEYQRLVMNSPQASVVSLTLYVPEEPTEDISPDNNLQISQHPSFPFSTFFFALIFVHRIDSVLSPNGLIPIPPHHPSQLLISNVCEHRGILRQDPNSIEVAVGELEFVSTIRGMV